ncbi:Htur_1727 family rSAM-partnered candidate RiPP [Halorussus limi]|uniref:Htur_1727 family rSAM-partnered candidate RiPP n=1 Tax=Halorussus limi TaxID=2938695 RepID=A0A8U0HSL0_9EURY|nr:Htur_1727 family rSAM-partnered candidate RiPP [Halorussus limi]UPV73654.1 Htur_1727 family rSAM-partnered candidate RiPP [Halorussus limi]
MVEKARRARVEESRPDAEAESGADADREWEILAREGADDPPRYVGTVRAEDAAAAHEEATRLFCWYDREVWVCPAGAIRRFSADADDAGDSESELAVPESGSEGRTHEL